MRSFALPENGVLSFDYASNNTHVPRLYRYTVIVLAGSCLLALEKIKTLALTRTVQAP